MQNKDFIKNIWNALKAGDEISPVLFMWNDLAKVHFEVGELINNLFQEFNVDKNNIISLIDDGNSIKIEDVKKLISKSFIRTNFSFQIFYIENISRLTLKASNAMLKFLEEPWVWNIVILTNRWEANVLETIISRVKIFNIESIVNINKNLLYYEMIESYIQNNDYKLLWFMYTQKLDNIQYKEFLLNLFLYIKENLPNLDYSIISLLSEIEAAITWIEKNNLMAKYQIDKILLKLK